jgi:subtilisin family serine protease
MSRPLVATTVGALVALVSASSFGVPAKQERSAPVRYTGPIDALDVVGGVRSDRILVKLARGAVLDDARRASLTAHGALHVAPMFPRNAAHADLADHHGLDRWFAVDLERGSDAMATVAALRALPGSEAFERIDLEGIGGILGVLPNDPSFGLQYGLHNTGQTINGSVGVVDADLDLPEAWALHTGTSDIVIAVIDTGVSNSHPDLAPKLVAGWNTIADSTNADDSFLISHGTHCAGIAAAAANNGIGVAGVSWGARIMPVKVLTFIGSGVEGDVADGVLWAADNGAHIASMSLGFPGSSAIVEDAVNYATDAGMLVVAATGNTAGAPISAPAKYEAVLAVGAVNNKDQIASFTSTGPEMDVVAPGVDVYSTWDVFFQPNTYTYQSGTSMACPHVAGLAALVWSANPTLTNLEVRAILESTAEDRGAPGWDPIYGHGRVHALAAVKAAQAPSCLAADFDCDGVVGPADIAALLGAWGAATPATTPFDLDGDGDIGPSDLAEVIGAWTT